MVVLNINSAAHTIFFKEGGKIIVITVNWQVMNEKKSSKISLEEDPNARACKGKVFFLPAVLKSQKKTNPPQPSKNSNKKHHPDNSEYAKQKMKLW